MTLAHRLPAAGSVAASDERVIIVRLLNVIYLENEVQHVKDCGLVALVHAALITDMRY